MSNDATISGYHQDEEDPSKYCEVHPQDQRVPEFVFSRRNGTKHLFCELHAWEFFDKREDFRRELLFTLALAKSS